MDIKSPSYLIIFMMRKIKHRTTGENKLMKLLSELQKKETISLYCHSCKKIKDHKTLGASTGDIILKCDGCNIKIRIPSQNYIKKIKEIDADYLVDGDYKIGQRLFHPVFKEKGWVIGKTENSIFVDFEKHKLKQLVINFYNKK